MTTKTKKGWRAVAHRFKIRIETLKEKVSAGGIIMETNMFHKDLDKINKGLSIGTVVDIGPTAMKGGFGDPNEIKIGDMIKYTTNAGMIDDSEYKHSKTNLYRFINDEDVYGVLDKDEIEEYYTMDDKTKDDILNKTQEMLRRQ